MTEINLLPRRRRSVTSMWGYLVVGVALVSVVGGLLLIASGSKKTPVVEEAKRVEEGAAPHPGVEEGAARVAEIGERQHACMEMLDRIQEAIPPFIWLTHIAAVSGDEVLVQGIAFSQRRIREFAQRLGAAEESPIRKDSFKGRTVFRFSLIGRLPRGAARAPAPAFIAPDARAPMIEAILRKGKALNLEIAGGPERISLEPSAVRERFHLRGEGPYDRLRAFVDCLAGLLPEAARVSRIGIAAEEAACAGAGTLTATFALDFYVAQE